MDRFRNLDLTYLHLNSTLPIVWASHTNVHTCTARLSIYQVVCSFFCQWPHAGFPKSTLGHPTFLWTNCIMFFCFFITRLADLRWTRKRRRRKKENRFLDIFHLLSTLFFLFSERWWVKSFLSWFVVEVVAITRPKWPRLCQEMLLCWLGRMDGERTNGCWKGSRVFFHYFHLFRLKSRSTQELVRLDIFTCQLCRPDMLIPGWLPCLLCWLR